MANWLVVALLTCSGRPGAGTRAGFATALLDVLDDARGRNREQRAALPSAASAGRRPAAARACQAARSSQPVQQLLAFKWLNGAAWATGVRRPSGGGSLCQLFVSLASLSGLCLFGLLRHRHSLACPATWSSQACAHRAPHRPRAPADREVPGRSRRHARGQGPAAMPTHPSSRRQRRRLQSVHRCCCRPPNLARSTAFHTLGSSQRLQAWHRCGKSLAAAPAALLPTAVRRVASAMPPRLEPLQAGSSNAAAGAMYQQTPSTG